MQMSYKKYYAEIEYDDDLDMFMGRVINLKNVITFYGKSVEELHKEFEISVKEYLSFCKERSLSF